MDRYQWSQTVLWVFCWALFFACDLAAAAQVLHDGSLPSLNDSIIASQRRLGEVSHETIGQLDDAGGRKTICQTSACKATAQKILVRLNSSVDPCTDFYEFACGRWISTHEIPDNETFISEFKDVSEELKRTKQDILETMRGHMFASEVKAKSLYAQCKNEDARETLRSQPLIREMDEFLGGWPILNAAWNASNFDIFDVVTKIYAVGATPLFTLQVTSDVGDPTTNLVMVSGPETFGAKDVLSSETGPPYTQSFLMFMLNITSLLLKDDGSAMDAEKFLPNLTDIIEIQRAFAMSGLNAVEGGKESIYTNKVTLDEFQKNGLHSRFMRNFTGVIQAIFAPANLSDAITGDTLIINPNPKFLEQLDRTMVEIEEGGDEGKRRLANLAGWQMVSDSISFLAKDFTDALSEHAMRISGRKVKRDTPIDERCTDSVTAAMPLVVGAMYVRDVIPTDLKKKAKMMVADIQAGFRELVEAATWMDNVTYTNAIKKLTDMIEIVGFPDIMAENMTAIDEEYKIIVIRPTYFETMMASSRNAVAKNLKKLITKNLRYDEAKDTPDITDVNAYYDPQRNMLILLAGILQLPFYNDNSPQYANYGGLGFILGHEITHGFDDTGANYDEIGYRRSWWTKDTLNLYDERKQAIVYQYGNYSTPAGKVNADLTLGENIADNGGLRAAYRGYLLFRKRALAPEPLLPGLENFSAEQLFFLSFGQAWCEKERMEIQQMELLTEAHAPNKIRVNGPASNMPEFSEAFKCRVGSTMNPARKNVVW